MAAYKGERVRKLIETRGWGLLFLPSYSPDFRVADGCPANVLLEASQEEWPSLVVVGSRGLAGIMRTTLGRVSTKVVTASCGPVLVCPHVE